MRSFMRSLVQSCKTCYKNPKQFLLIAVCDLLFLFLGGYALTTLMDKVAQHIAAVNMISEDVSAVAGQQLLSNNDLSFLVSQQALFQTFYSKILTLLFLQGTVFFVLWTIIEGFGWWKAAQLQKGVKRIPLRRHYGRFAFVTLLFLGLLTIGIFLFSSIATSNMLQLVKISSISALTTLFAVLFVVLGYFWFVGNSLIQAYPLRILWKKIFSAGILEAKKYFSLFALVVVLGVAFYRLFVWLSVRYITLTFAYLLIILPLYLAWVKVVGVQRAD